VSDFDEAALMIQRTTGAIESFDETNRIRIEKIEDIQLNRAKDLLEGILLYGELSKPEKMAAK
jgi:hypothetical protein